MSQATAWAPIVKTEKNADGTLYVYGKVSDDTLDGDQQVCDPDWLKTAVPEWYRTGGNIREQHTTLAAGTAVSYEEKPDGHYIKALVVDPVSVLKVDNRVLKGFSVGIKRPRVVLDKVAKGGRIVDGRIVEVSLVDRPCNPACTLTVVKSDAAGRPVHVEQTFVETDAPLLVYPDLGKTDRPTEIRTAVALRALAELIADEATGLADGEWSESYDISRLLDAVRALQSFAYSEASEDRDSAVTETVIDLSGSISEAAAQAVSAALKSLPSHRGPAASTAKADTMSDTTKTEAEITADQAAADAAAANKTEGSEDTPEFLTKGEAADFITKTDLAQIVQDAMTKAMEPLEERLAKVEGTPENGGPQLVRTVEATKAAQAKDDEQLKAEIAELLAKSEAASDPALRDGYAARADAKRALLTK